MIKMRSSSVGRRSSTNPVKIPVFERNDRSLTRTDSRRTQTHKPKISISASDSSHIPRPRMRASSSDRAGNRCSVVKGTGKTSLSQHVPSTPGTPGNKYNNFTLSGSSNKVHAGLPLGRRSPSAERASNIGAKGPRKDTRPLTDKTYQAQMLAKIDNYFSINQCILMLNSNGSLKPITLKMFVEVSGYLVKILNIKQVLTIANYVEELPKIAKKLHYPGIITKSWLKTANAMHSWPNVLGWISWLVEVCEITESAFKIYHLDNLPFMGTEQEAEINRKTFFAILNSYVAWNDEKLDEEAVLVNKYLQEIENQQGISEENLNDANSVLEEEMHKFEAIERNSNKVDKEVKHIKEMLSSLQKNEAQQMDDINAKEEYVKVINCEADRISTENNILCKQMELQNEQYQKLLLAIKQQPMTKAERDKILEKCTEIQNYMLQFNEHLQDIQKELYTMDIKLASANNNINKIVLAYNKEIFMHFSNDIGIDLEELKMPDKGVLHSDIMEVINTKSNLMNDLKELLRKKLNEQECSVQACTNELEAAQERIKFLEDESIDVADKVKEQKRHMSKLKTDIKQEEAKLKGQIKSLQNDIKEIQEAMPNVKQIMDEMEEAADKLNAVRRRKAYLEESAKMFFAKFYEILGEHRSKLHTILTKCNS